MSNIFLIGFMGSGKSTLGRPLAEKMNYEFIDLDHYIETKEACSINELFTTRGESFFRECESFHLRSLGEKQHLIVATGGGAPCFFDNMKWMNENGLTIYLQVSDEELFRRLKPGIAHRPLLAGKSDDELQHFIRMKITERKQYYLSSKKIISADILNAQQLYESIFAH